MVFADNFCVVVLGRPNVSPKSIPEIWEFLLFCKIKTIGSQQRLQERQRNMLLQGFSVSESQTVLIQRFSEGVDTWCNRKIRGAIVLPEAPRGCGHAHQDTQEQNSRKV